MADVVHVVDVFDILGLLFGVLIELDVRYQGELRWCPISRAREILGRSRWGCCFVFRGW